MCVSVCVCGHTKCSTNKALYTLEKRKRLLSGVSINKLSSWIRLCCSVLNAINERRDGQIHFHINTHTHIYREYRYLIIINHRLVKHAIGRTLKHEKFVLAKRIQYRKTWCYWWVEFWVVFGAFLLLLWFCLVGEWDVNCIVFTLNRLTALCIGALVFEKLDLYIIVFICRFSKYIYTRIYSKLTVNLICCCCCL